MQAVIGHLLALRLSGGPAVVNLPFYVEDHFFMSGYMGDGEVAVEPCEEVRWRTLHKSDLDA